VELGRSNAGSFDGYPILNPLLFICTSLILAVLARLHHTLWGYSRRYLINAAIKSF
jgi:hypothetical protein